VTDDPVATLTALAAVLRFRALEGDAEWAEHIDGVIERHRPDAFGWQTCTGCEAPGADYWPCPEVRELLAVAEAIGVTG
jgi:hypothetical protein